MKIYAPVKNATGVWCSVHFQDGVGETDNPHLIDWFKKHGYAVDNVQSNSVIEPSNDEVEVKNDEVDLESMTPNEIREWAKANGYSSKIKNIRNKEKLLEIIRG